MVAVAIVMVRLSCQWGSLDSGMPVLILPGGSTGEGLMAAPWLAQVPFGGLVLAVLAPMICVAVAVWVLARAGSTGHPDGN